MMNKEWTKKYENAWIVKYMNKTGKTLDTLAASLTRSTKAEVIRKADEIGVWLSEVYTKNDMVSLILTELEDNGYCHTAQEPKQEQPKRKKTKVVKVEYTITWGLKYWLENGRTDYVFRIGGEFDWDAVPKAVMAFFKEHPEEVEKIHQIEANWAKECERNNLWDQIATDFMAGRDMSRYEKFLKGETKDQVCAFAHYAAGMPYGRTDTKKAALAYLLRTA